VIRISIIVRNGGYGTALVVPIQVNDDQVSLSTCRSKPPG
jgi:hypothetical protein